MSFIHHYNTVTNKYLSTFRFEFGRVKWNSITFILDKTRKNVTYEVSTYILSKEGHSSSPSGAPHRLQILKLFHPTLPKNQKVINVCDRLWPCLDKQLN
jgi:hypothetical protein